MFRMDVFHASASGNLIYPAHPPAPPPTAMRGSNSALHGRAAPSGAQRKYPRCSRIGRSNGATTAPAAISSRTRQRWSTATSHVRLHRLDEDRHLIEAGGQSGRSTGYARRFEPVLPIGGRRGVEQQWFLEQVGWVLPSSRRTPGVGPCGVADRHHLAANHIVGLQSRPLVGHAGEQRRIGRRPGRSSLRR